MTIANGEGGASVRAKINQAFSDIQTLSSTTAGQTSDILTLQSDAAKAFEDVASLFADTTLGYSKPAPNQVVAGDIITAGGFRYEVALAGASDHHRTTAGGVKLYVLPDAGGYNVKAFGAAGDGVTSDHIAIQAAINAADADGGGTVVFDGGETYLVSSLIRLKTNVSLIGNGCTISVDPMNYTGGITQFYGVFSTVDIASRPQPILWRIGTGTISFEDIRIDGFTFQINRDGNILTSGQMDLADINVVRFEDARNCKVTNCRFIDGETFANNNGNQVVYFVRSEMCDLSNCYANQTTLVYIAECKNCTAANNTIPVSVGTSIETVAGQSHVVTGNKIGVTWWAVSCIGINSRQCKVFGNTIDEAAISGITIGHPTPTGTANFYSLALDANFSTCRDNYILSGDDLTTNHGYIGILVQAGSYVTIGDNTILNLRKKASLNDRAAGVLVQPDVVASATGVRIGKNRISTANNGIHVVRGEAIFAAENAIRDAYAGFHYESTANAPRLVVNNNFIGECDRAVQINDGYAEISGLW